MSYGVQLALRPSCVGGGWLLVWQRTGCRDSSWVLVPAEGRISKRDPCPAPQPHSRPQILGRSRRAQWRAGCGAHGGVPQQMPLCCVR